MDLSSFSIILAFSLFPLVAFSESISCNQSALLDNLSPCLPSLAGNATAHPGSDCCNPFGSLLASQPTCLCLIAPLAGEQLNLSIPASNILAVAAHCNFTVPASVPACLTTNSYVPSEAPFALPSPTPTAGGGLVGQLDSGTSVSPSLFVAGVFVALICAILAF